MTKKSTTKTNAIRILDQMNIEYDTADYEVTDGEIAGVSVAEKIGASPEVVYKTIVTRGKEEIYVFCVPSNEEIDLKKAAKACNEKKIEPVKVKELFELTGYIRGGCSPIGMKKKYPVFLEETAQILDSVYVSAGRIGTQIKLKVKDLVTVTEATLCDLV
jgi:Cys-tRNA(Pro)/Cys-tRNA(Cys) deacylase